MTPALLGCRRVTREPISAVAVSALPSALITASRSRANRRAGRLGIRHAVCKASVACLPRNEHPHRVGVPTRAATFPGRGLPRAGGSLKLTFSVVGGRMNDNKRERGQGLVEFALILPILLLTVLLFLYFAQLFNTWSGLQAGAVAGARQASDSGSVSKVEEVVKETLQAHGVGPGDVAVTTTVLNPDGSPKGCWVELCPVEFGDLVLVEVVKPFEIRVLGWQAAGELPASHQVRAQHGVWLP